MQNENFNFVIRFLIWNEKKVSKNIFHFSSLINAVKNEKLKRILFLALFWLKTNFKTQKIKIFEFILWFQIKKWIWKSYFIFPFWLWNWKMKNENFSKFVLLLNQKTNYTFSTRIVLCFMSQFQCRNKNQNFISNFIFQFIKKTKWHFGYTD